MSHRPFLNRWLDVIAHLLFVLIGTAFVLQAGYGFVAAIAYENASYLGHSVMGIFFLTLFAAAVSD